MIAELDGKTVKSEIMQKETSDKAPARVLEERLVIKDRDNLHLLARFFQAMILNFLKEPAKVLAIEGLNLIVAFDPTGHPDNALTLAFENGRVTLEKGINPNTDMRIMCEPAVMMKLSRVPAGPAVIKFLMTAEGRDIAARLLSGDLKIRGIAKHYVGMMKLSKFLGPSANLPASN
jgi:hypothetical protein